MHREGGFCRGGNVWKRSIRTAGDHLHHTRIDSRLGELFVRGIGEEKVHICPFFQKKGGGRSDFRGIQAVYGMGRAADGDELLLNDGVLRIPDAVLICGLC